MLYEANLSEQFWDFAIQHAIYLKNRLPTKALPFGEIQVATPYEAYTETAANTTKLRVFGCSATPILTQEIHRHTLSPRIKTERVFVGMKSSQIWSVLNCDTHKVEVYADCRFDEYRFPY